MVSVLASLHKWLIHWLYKQYYWILISYKNWSKLLVLLLCCLFTNLVWVHENTSFNLANIKVNVDYLLTSIIIRKIANSTAAITLQLVGVYYFYQLYYNIAHKATIFRNYLYKYRVRCLSFTFFKHTKATLESI